MNRAQHGALKCFQETLLSEVLLEFMADQCTFSFAVESKGNHHVVHAVHSRDRPVPSGNITLLKCNFLKQLWYRANPLTYMICQLTVNAAGASAESTQAMSAP